MKREWEKNLPPCDNTENIAKRKALISAMERDEYAFREQVNKNSNLYTILSISTFLGDTRTSRFALTLVRVNVTRIARKVARKIRNEIEMDVRIERKREE